MQQRFINAHRVSAIGFGCMTLSHAYGTPPDKQHAHKVLNHALDIGYTLLDTAALYGFGANEELLGEALAGRRQEYFLASKCGLFKNNEGKRAIDGHPEVLRKTCEDSLRRLKTEHIDLYYLHRWDKKVPIEESVGALSDLVEQGKIGAIGLSEVSAATLQKAHDTHPIAALQNEYSLFSRNPEIATLQLCQELGIAYVAFSPVGRGFLANVNLDPASFPEGDIRRNFPRFKGDALSHNQQLLQKFSSLAEQAGCSCSQLALAWLLTRGEHLIPIPGTVSLAHQEENFGALDVNLDADILQALDSLINQHTVAGERYPDAAMAEIDTENFS
jgi:aryl-alcohol dehydrogenase-like predicted oxidoreductase